MLSGCSLILGIRSPVPAFLQGCHERGYKSEAPLPEPSQPGCRLAADVLASPFHSGGEETFTLG